MTLVKLEATELSPLERTLVFGRQTLSRTFVVPYPRMTLLAFMAAVDAVVVPSVVNTKV